VKTERQNSIRFSRAPSPEPRAPTSAGFTLLELIIVIAVISLVVALVAPRLPSTDSSALRSSARALASTLRYLGESSITAKVNYRLHLNISGNSLKITRKLPNGDEVPPEDRLFSRKILGDRVFISDVQTSRLGKVTEGEVLIDFNAAGLAEYLTIHLNSGPGKDFTIVGFPNSGKIKIQEGYQEFSL